MLSRNGEIYTNVPSVFDVGAAASAGTDREGDGTSRRRADRERCLGVPGSAGQQSALPVKSNSTDLSLGAGCPHPAGFSFRSIRLAG